MRPPSQTGIQAIIQKNRAQQAVSNPSPYQQIMKALGRSGTYSRNQPQPEPTPSRFQEKTLQAKNLTAKTIGVQASPKRTAPTLKQTLEKQAAEQ